MRLDFSPALRVNNMISSYQINRSAANKAGVTRKEETERKDSFMRSPANNTNDFIQNLMKQKLDITDRKNALIADTKKNGASLESIKPQLEAFDEQLANIDIQISQAMTKEMEKQREKESPKDDEPKTKEELRYEKMTDVVTLSTDARHVNLVDSVKGSIDGRIKTLESEIEIDNSREGTFEGASAYKLEQLSELKQRSAKLEADIGFRMADIANEIEKDKDEISEEELSAKDEDETAENSDNE